MEFLGMIEEKLLIWYVLCPIFSLILVFLLMFSKASSLFLAKPMASVKDLGWNS